ncbi:hypothetical protein GOHSU_26_00150 [Gordonia hirsuta DSM 44140 = NBRC 16056]|uniref:Uncharacterized protein n=1 Tax=Gordonia hirsuta DSM 44140 = NBRC 16056 TaxID=1121927 RepID=L7LCU0_9ACTN|nr:hypothetical protein [Gordonia hirsuta]GAC57858.1 hypothetical protein GOHSU_26_00150 [Gordonia hirsuta DSM 44140 = NBRC 16056]
MNTLRQSPRLVIDAVRDATWRQAVVAVVVAALVGVTIGLVTVLIPNDVFGRDVAPVAWNYPVLVATAVLSGLLAATYVRADAGEGSSADDDPEREATAGRLGAVGVVVSWFAVGCPVCNKLALLALGYSGALTWFAPVQPVLGALGLVLLWAALAVRLRNARSCPLPAV